MQKAQTLDYRLWTHLYLPELIVHVIQGLSRLTASLVEIYLPKCFVLYQNNVLMLEMMVISKFSDCLRTNHFWASVQYSEASWSEILNLWFRILKDRTIFRDLGRQLLNCDVTMSDLCLICLMLHVSGRHLVMFRHVTSPGPQLSAFPMTISDHWNIQHTRHRQCGRQGGGHITPHTPHLQLMGGHSK